MIERREFLKRLGLGVGAISILPAWYRFGEVIPFRKALYTVPEIGIADAQWIVAETLTAISRRLDGHRFETAEYETDPLENKYQLRNGDNLYSIDVTLPDGMIGRPLDLANLREQIVEPTAAHYAEILGKFRRSMVLELPRSVEFAALSEDDETGLRLRFIRYFDIGEGRFINRFDARVSQ